MPNGDRRILALLFVFQVAVLVAALLPLTAGAAGSGTGGPAFIAPGELAKAIADGRKVLIVDVRERSEYEEERIPGAVHCPLRELDGRAASLVRGAELVVPYCMKDFRGYEGLRKLARVHPEVRLIQGYGILAWKRAGLPTEGSRAAGSR